MWLLILFGLAVLVPPFLLGPLARTPVYWLPTAVLIAVAALLYSYGIVTPHNGHEEAPGARGYDEIGNIIVTIVIVGLLVYALICFVIGRKLHQERRSTPPAIALPTATVVNGTLRS